MKISGLNEIWKNYTFVMTSYVGEYDVAENDELHNIVFNYFFIQICYVYQKNYRKKIKKI